MNKNQLLRIRRQRTALSKKIEDIVRKWFSLDYEVLKQRFIQLDKGKCECDAILRINGIYRVVEVKSYIGKNEIHVSSASSKTGRFNDVIVIEATINVKDEIKGRFDISEGVSIGDCIYFRYNILSVLVLGLCLNVIDYDYYESQKKRIENDYYLLVYKKE